MWRKLPRPQLLVVGVFLAGAVFSQIIQDGIEFMIQVIAGSCW